MRRRSPAGCPRAPGSAPPPTARGSSRRIVGVADPLDELRVSAAIPPAPGMKEYLEKVRTRAYAVTDEDGASLVQAGFTEDEIFEQTVAAAVSEGLRRLDAAAAVIE